MCVCVWERDIEKGRRYFHVYICVYNAGLQNYTLKKLSLQYLKAPLFFFFYFQIVRTWLRTFVLINGDITLLLDANFGHITTVIYTILLMCWSVIMKILNYIVEVKVCYYYFIMPLSLILQQYILKLSQSFYQAVYRRLLHRWTCLQSTNYTNITVLAASFPRFNKSQKVTVV